MLITALISPVRTPEVESRPDNFPEVTKLVHLRAGRLWPKCLLLTPRPLCLSEPPAPWGKRHERIRECCSVFPRPRILGSAGNWAGEGEGVGHPHSPRVVPGPAGRGRAGTLRRSPPARCTCWRPGAAPSFPEGGGAEMCTRSASGGVAAAPRSPAHITCCSELNASRKLPLISPFGALGLIKSGFPLSLKSQHQVTQR